MKKQAAFVVCMLTAAAWVAAAVQVGRTSGRPDGLFRWQGGRSALSSRLAWAVDAAAGSGKGGRIWIGYSIKRLAGENEFCGSICDDRAAWPSVEDILAGRAEAAPKESDVRQTAKAVLEDLNHPRPKSDRKVVKSLGIFLGYEAGRAPVLEKVEMSDLNLPFDFESRPLYWLGEAEAAESLTTIRDLYRGQGGVDIKKGLLMAAGVHQAPRLVVPFLKEVLFGTEPEELRKAAAFWMSQQDDREGLALLVRAAGSDRSEEVRESAVFGISQVDLPEAADELIALARGASSAGTRKKAVFWLGEVASKKAAPVLESMAEKDGDAEIREQAVFALSQLPDGQGVDTLIKLARTSPDPRVRKRAIFWLGETNDPRAVDVLVEIVKGKPGR